MDKIKNRENSGISVHGDIYIIEQSNKKVNETVDKLHTESERYGMHINVIKTKTMVFGEKARRE